MFKTLCSNCSCHQRKQNAVTKWNGGGRGGGCWVSCLLTRVSLTFYVVVSLQDSDKVQQSVEGAGAADDFEKTKPGKGAITSDYYRTFNIPERFDNPGMSHSFLQITL